MSIAIQTKRTAWLLRVLAVLYALQTAIAGPTSQQMIRPYITLGVNIANTVLICALCVYCANRLNKGRHLGATMGLTAYLLIQSLLIVGFTFIEGSHSVVSLKFVHVIYFMLCLVTFGSVFKTWVHTN